MRKLAILSLLFSIPFLASAEEPPDCTTPEPNLHLKAVAPVVGETPVWATLYPGCWSDQPSKTVVIVDRNYQGTLRLQAHLDDGSAMATFDPHQATELVIESAHQGGVTPGGISEEEFRRYSFHMASFSFPVPGCWHVFASLGEYEVTIPLLLPVCAEAPHNGVESGGAGKPLVAADAALASTGACGD